jgi:glycosyltransferase involved in cell wall biosynthesis
LYVGSAYPHKNLKLLVELAELRNDIDILLVGKEDYFMQQVKELNPPDHVKFLGFVPDHTLEQLYTHAHAYVFPSEYEGFGLPGLEAMHKGCPVISSNATCLPEILGDAALYFAPHDVYELSAHITQLEDARVREKYISRGLQQVERYTWQKTAKETLEIYERF